MKNFRLLAIAALSCLAAWSDDTPASSTVQKPGVTVPPVLRSAEPVDDVVVMLPGTPSKPVVTEAPVRATFVETVRPEDPERPFLRRPKHDYPEGFEEDSAQFLHQHLGEWSEEEAFQLLGEASNSRPSYDDDMTVNGQIFAFSDPTGRYKSLELDFDKETNKLRSVFVYPQQMSWLECRKQFGTNVRATQAGKGRTFYSYADRRLDVLVDQTGKVISLGMY